MINLIQLADNGNVTQHCVHMKEREKRETCFANTDGWLCLVDMDRVVPSRNQELHLAQSRTSSNTLVTIQIGSSCCVFRFWRFTTNPSEIYSRQRPLIFVSMKIDA